MKDKPHHPIARLIKQIETQLAWGDSNSWSSKDFQELSELIWAKTGNRISVTTLKRAWGRAQNTSRLSQASLDILAQFLDFESWRDFKEQHQEKNLEEEIPAKKGINFRILGVVAFALLAPLLFFIQSGSKMSDTVYTALTEEELRDVQFDLEKVTIGYPNTVLFRYDIGNLPFDSLQIQQSWDESKRIFLDSSKGLATSTYYHPGYYQAKLVLNNQIIRQQDLYIPTDGWQALIGGNVPNPIYIKKNQLLQDTSVRFQQDILTEMNHHPFSVMWLSNLNSNPQIESSNLTFESTFRLLQPIEKSICKAMTLAIIGTKEVFLFQFSIPGCTGDLVFALGGTMILGKHTDLTAFGVEAGHWIDFKVKTTNNKLEAFFGERKIYEYKLTSNIGLVGGVSFSFEGLGEVKSVRMSDGEREVVL